MSLGFNRAQRVVLVVALAAALFVFGLWVTHLGALPGSGWVGYAPLSATFVSPRLGGGLPSWGRMLIWLGLIGGWAGASVVLLRSKRAGSP